MDLLPAEEDSFKPSLYPNPTNSIINLSFISDKDSPYEIHIFGIDGQDFYDQSLELLTGDEFNTTIDISTLPEGIYVLTIRKGSKFSWSERFVKVE